MSGLDQPDQGAISARFLVLRTMPVVVLDVEAPEDDAPALLQATLFRRVVDLGLATLPRFYDQALPQGARVGFALRDDELRLEDEQGDGLLRVARASLPGAWIEAALRLRGTMLYVARELDMDPDLTPRQLCDLLEHIAGQDRLAAAIVGVGEEQTSLPLF